MKRLIIIITLTLLLAAFATAQQIPHGVTLSWSWTGKGTATYNIYRTTISGGEAKPALATGVNLLTYTDSSAVVNQQYYYTVTSIVGGIESAPSTEVGALITVPPSPQSPGTSIF